MSGSGDNAQKVLYVFFSGVNKKVPFKTFFSAQFQFVKEKEYL